MAKTVETDVRRACGANIKGTPSMRGSKVAADLKVISKKADVIVLQEFKWDWYWRVLGRVLAAYWGSWPGRKIGVARPVDGAQGILWRRKIWKKIDTRKRLLMRGRARISEHRYLRAVLLEDRLTGLRCWFMSTHFVVGGDEKGDSELRKQILRSNIAMLGAFLDKLAATGEPVWCELDANIHQGSEAYPLFMEMVKEHNLKIHGKHGVEYVLTGDGRDTDIVVVRDWEIGVGQLNTDHEVRGTNFYLRTKA